MPSLVAGLVLVAVYASVLCFEYGVTDDYVLGLDTSLHRNVIQDGRPALMLLLYAAHQVVEPSVEGFWRFRLASLLLLLVFAHQLVRWLSRHGYGPAHCAAVAVMLCTLPAVQVYLNWVCNFTVVLGLVLSLAALRLVDRVCAGWTGWRDIARIDWRFAAPRLLLAGLLQLLSLTIYQPAAMAYFALLGAAVWSRDPEPWQRQRWPLAGSLAVGGAALAAYAGAVLWIQATWGSSIPARAASPGLLVGKLSWLVTEVVPGALELWRIDGDGRLAPWVALAIVAGFALDGVARLRAGESPAAVLGDRAQRALLLCGLFVLGYLPSLAVPESHLSFRSRIAVMSLVAIVLARSLAADRRASARRQQIGLALLAAVAVLAAASAWWNVRYTYAVPQAKEWQYLKERLASGRERIEQTGHIHLIRPHWSQGPAPETRMDEFGLPSTHQPWVPEPMIRAALRSIGISGTGIVVTHVAATSEAEPPESALVLDFRELRRLR